MQILKEVPTKSWRAKKSSSRIQKKKTSEVKNVKLDTKYTFDRARKRAIMCENMKEKENNYLEI